MKTKPENNTNAPIFSAQVGGAYQKLSGLGDGRDEIASWIVYRLTHPKAKILKNNKKDKNGGWSSMSRNACLASRTEKPVTLDERQDCWQTCITLLFQNHHLQGEPIILENGEQLKIGGIHLFQGVYALFSACRDILRINNRAGDFTESLDSLTETGMQFAFPHKAEKKALARDLRAKAFRENLSLIRLAYKIDSSRQREANRKNAICFLRSIADGTIARLEKSTRSMRKKAFLDYTQAAKNAREISTLAQDMSALK